MLLSHSDVELLIDILHKMYGSFGRKCFKVSVSGTKILNDMFDTSAKLVAGTARWRIVDKDRDDGVRPTFFGHEWGGCESRVLRIQENSVLPELHCWIEIEGRQILDVTTGDLISTLEQFGLKYDRLRKPPPYILTEIVRTDDYEYEHVEQATDLVRRIANLKE